jgi:outer membrane immunogenic protein
MKKIILATVLAGLSSTAALTADLGARAPYAKAPAMMEAVGGWSGFYIGGNVGYGWGTGGTDVSGVPSNAALDISSMTLGDKSRGVIGGAQIGYNWQMGSIVTGLEADIQGSGIKGAASAPFGFASGAPATNTFSTDSKLSWFGTVRGRLGVVVAPALMFYGTAGLAYGQTEHSANLNERFGTSNNFNFGANANSTKVGWAAGAGAEWAFARNWSLKAEYLHIDLGSVSADGVLVDNVGPDPRFAARYRWNNREEIVRAGLNYHF